MGVSLDELVDLGHGVRITHATVDFLHGLGPKEAWAVIFFKWPGSALARMGTGGAWEAIEGAHRRICRFHSTDGKCVHTMYEPRVVPCEEAPRVDGAEVPWGDLARGARAALRRPAGRAMRKKPDAAAGRRLLGLPWLQAVGILFGIAVGMVVVAGALAQALG